MGLSDYRSMVSRELDSYELNMQITELKNDVKKLQNVTYFSKHPAATVAGFVDMPHAHIHMAQLGSTLSYQSSPRKRWSAHPTSQIALAREGKILA